MVPEWKHTRLPRRSRDKAASTYLQDICGKTIEALAVDITSTSQPLPDEGHRTCCGGH